MSGLTSYGLIYYIAELSPWLICCVAFVLNVDSIAKRSKTPIFNSQFRCYTSKVVPSAAAIVQMLFPTSVSIEDGTDPLMDELTKCAAQEKQASGSLPLLTYLRDLSMADSLQSAHCSAALVHLAHLGDLEGVQGVLMLTSHAGITITNSMVTDVIILLCEKGGDNAALEIYRDLCVKSDYFLDAPVLEVLLRAAARLSQLQEVERIFKQLHAVGQPSVRAYALAIHALGQHGAVNDAVSLFEDLLVRRSEDGSLEDVSMAWNSLLSVLTRNACVRRAIAVFHRGRSENFHILPPVALALCQMAPDEIAVPDVWIGEKKQLSRHVCPTLKKRQFTERTAPAA